MAAGRIDAATQRRQRQRLQEAAQSGDLELNRSLWQVAAPTGLSKRQMRRAQRRERADEKARRADSAAAAEAVQAQALPGADAQPATARAAGLQRQEIRRARQQRRRARAAVRRKNGASQEAELASSSDDSDAEEPGRDRSQNEAGPLPAKPAWERMEPACEAWKRRLAAAFSMLAVSRQGTPCCPALT